jgi:Mrp family chromosome partitioning ATPase
VYDAAWQQAQSRHGARTEPEVSMDTKVVAVTGASAGIGRATAIAFAQRGWRVALAA